LLTHPDNASLADRGRWTGLFFSGAKGTRNDDLCALCPTTSRVIDTLPVCRNFGFVAFSGMEPHTHVAAHCGSSNLRLRYHLGVEVPEPGKSWIRVGTERRSWRQGRVLAFDDSFEHEVVHDGDRPRVVLIVDVWQPSLSAAEIAVLSDPVFQMFGKT
jgi:aspartate beta-hydroxylase